jgi:hypothetical protein
MICGEDYDLLKLGQKMAGTLPGDLRTITPTLLTSVTMFAVDNNR